MKWLLLMLLALEHLSGQALPVISMRMAPDELADGLREGKPVPPSDCQALNLFECYPDQKSKITDISLRWVQLDSDSELEAILILEAPQEQAYMAYVFDQQDTWNLIGKFLCGRSCDGNSLIRIQRLTADSPPLVLSYGDLGGSGQVLLMTKAFDLRGGKLWPVAEFKNYEEVSLLAPYREWQYILESPHRLVIHTIRQGAQAAADRSRCEVLRWDAAKNSFVQVPQEQTNYCDPNSGRPIKDKSFPAGLPVHP